MSEEKFVSSMPYEVWEKWVNQKNPEIEHARETILLCVDNVAYFGIMTARKQELMNLVPYEELLVMRPDGEWDENTYVPDKYHGKTFCLPRTWLPPEKPKEPKELIGLEYLESNKEKIILLDSGEIIVTGEKYYTFVQQDKSSSYAHYDQSPFVHIDRISPSNSTIIYPRNESVERIEELQNILGEMERVLAQSFNLGTHFKLGRLIKGALEVLENQCKNTT